MSSKKTLNRPFNATKPTCESRDLALVPLIPTGCAEAIRWPSAERRGFLSTSLPSAYPPHRAKIGLAGGPGRAGLNNFAPSGLAFFCIQLFVVCTQLLCLSLDMKTLGGRKMFKKIGYAQFLVTPARRAELLSPPRPGSPANPGPPPGAVFAWRAGNPFLVCWGR